MKTTLVVMAGGMASRYGSLKQLEKFGPNGEKIVDYSIYDAKRAGFDKVVFVIRKENLEIFKSELGDRISKHIPIEYAFQCIDEIPEGSKPFIERQKPWGTSHAIWSCRNLVKEPFAVINADDYYGPQAFKLVHDFLVNSKPSDKKDYCLAGYILKNTLTENGSVSRGVCECDGNDILTGIKENKKIEKADGVAKSYLDDGSVIDLPLSSPVSMNFWGLTPDIFDRLEKDLVDFFAAEHSNPEKAECLLPESIDNCIKDGYAQVTVLKTDERWFGVTYKEDKPVVEASIRELVNSGKYPEKLWD